MTKYIIAAMVACIAIVVFRSKIKYCLDMVRDYLNPDPAMERAFQARKREESDNK